MRTITLLLALVFLPLAASASTLTFGDSWDGQPPGTVADLFGVGGWASGLVFGAGSYDFVVLGGITADTTDTLAVEDTPDGWYAIGTSRDLPGGSPSYGPQWAWYQVTVNAWLWGWEDLTLDISDHDYQDRFGTLTRRAEVTPRCVECDQVPVPEPSAVWLVLAGVLGVRLLSKEKP